MPEMINPPPLLTGEERQQLQQLRSYLYETSEAINRNLQMIGGNELSDRERAAVQGVIQTGSGLDDVASLRDMVVRLAENVKQAVGRIQTYGLQDEVASGRFGRFVQATTISLPADLDGHSGAEQLAAAMARAKEENLRARSCIYIGTLREGVSGIAIGKDVVTFAEDGTETFVPGNTMIEITEGGDVNIYGALRGGTTGTEETNLNAVTEDGKYWIDIAGMSNRPSGVNSGTFLMEVSNTTGIIHQRLEGTGAVYIRRNTGTWGSWYKYTGTAV